MRPSSDDVPRMMDEGSAHFYPKRGSRSRGLRQPEAKRLQYNAIHPSSSGEIDVPIISSCTFMQTGHKTHSSGFNPAGSSDETSCNEVEIAAHLILSEMAFCHSMLYRDPVIPLCGKTQLSVLKSPQLTECQHALIKTIDQLNTCTDYYEHYYDRLRDRLGKVYA
ncbi:unnamed protein product, partial [Protopolystoma xenopodis]